MYDIITFGSATQDIFVKPKKLTSLGYKKEQHDVCFPVGSKIEIEKMEFASGGGGTNAAATFALQGLKTAYIGVIGSDQAGKDVVAGLKKLGVDTRSALVTDKKPTNHSIIILGDGTDRTILAYRGAAELLAQDDIPFKKIKAKWMYLAPLTGLLCDNFKVLADFAKTHSIKLAANPSMAQLSLPDFQRIASQIDVLITNQEEASFLTKISQDQESKTLAAMHAMCKGVIVLTKGGAGASVFDGKTLYSVVPPADRFIADTTGAGDAFASGFVSEYMQSGNIEKAIQLAMANSVGCISKIGAKNGLLKKSDKYTPVSVIKKLI